MSPGVAIVRADICAACPTPCGPRPYVGDPCASCPIHRWGQHDCGSPAPAELPGDALAARIERYVLAPAEAHAPGIVQAVRRCVGCAQAKHAMGSASSHPDPGVVV